METVFDKPLDKEIVWAKSGSGAYLGLINPDNYTQNGYYHCETTINGESIYGVLAVYVGYDGHIQQVLFGNWKTFVRSKNSAAASWGSWRELADKTYVYNKCTYWTMLDGITLTSSYVTKTTYNNRKISDYEYFVVELLIGDWLYNGGIFTRQRLINNVGYALFTHSGGNVFEVDIKYKSDTSFDVKYIGSTGSTVKLYIWGLNYLI